MKKEVKELLGTECKSSNNRRWMAAYRSLVNRLNVLQNIPKPWTIEQSGYIEGYKEAVKEFTGYATRKLK